MKTQKRKVIVILGPTASGKTSIAVRLAREINGEIISADSRQIYKGLDIGSGKDLSEYGEVRYHLIDILHPGEKYSSARFQLDAIRCLYEISDNAKTPIICGGSAYYVKALLDDYEFTSISTDFKQSRYRESLPRDSLYKIIKKLGLWNDRDWNQDSKRRMSRTIEKATYNQTQIEPQSRFNTDFIARIYHTSVNRDLLRSRIYNRLTLRMNQGLIQEVDDLIKQGHSPEKLESLGLEYRWTCRYLRGELSLEDMKQRLFIDICRFAKRQKTFLRYMKKSGYKMNGFIRWNSFYPDVLNWLN